MQCPLFSNFVFQSKINAMKLKNVLLDFGTNPVIAKLTKPIVETLVSTGELANINTVHERLQICRQNQCGCYTKKGDNEVCNVNTGGCGCFLTEKTRLEGETCPKKLW